MPKRSKVSRKPIKTSTRPGEAPPEKPKLDKYICTRCGKVYIRQKSNFPASQSPLFAESGYLPICNHCADNLYDHYKEALGSGEAAMRRLCMKFDIYWNPEIWMMINKVNTSVSRVRQYISKTFLIRYIGRSYDDTLDEESGYVNPVTLETTVIDSPDGEDDVATVRTVTVPAETVQFWGAGFDVNTYDELNMRFERWTKDLPKPLPIVEEALYKQICIQEAQINKRAIAGQDIEKGQNTLNSLLSSLSIKPNQKKDDPGDADLESTPLGVWARRWEEDLPIPDGEDIPEPKVIKYITTWFFGHVAKCLGLKNMYSKVYEDEIAKYRVEKPEYDGEDDDLIISDIVDGGDSE